MTICKGLLAYFFGGGDVWTKRVTSALKSFTLMGVISRFVVVVVMGLVFFISISVVKALHSSVGVADPFPLVGEKGFVRFTPVIVIVNNAKYLIRQSGVVAPTLIRTSKWQRECFAWCKHESSRSIAPELKQTKGQGISCPTGEPLIRGDISCGSLAEIYNAYSKNWLLLKTVISRINSLHIGSKIRVAGLVIRTSLNPTKNDGSYCDEPSCINDLPSGTLANLHRFTLLRFVARILCWLLTFVWANISA